MVGNEWFRNAAITLAGTEVMKARVRICHLPIFWSMRSAPIAGMMRDEQSLPDVDE